MTSSVEKKIITALFGLALLMTLSTAIQISNTQSLLFLGLSFSSILGLAYYFFNCQIQKQQLAAANFQDLHNDAPCEYYSINVASEKRLRAIIKAEPDCVKVLALDGTLQEMNAAGLAIIEADDLQQVIGQSLSSLVIPKYREAFITLTQEAAEGNPGALEFEIIGLRGTHRWLESHAVPLRNHQNEIVGVLAITRDITARQQTEEALRQSEEQLRLALEATNMGSWDWNILTDELIWSSGHEQLFGLDVGTFNGKYETFSTCIHPEDLEALEQAVNRARWERQNYHHEYRVIWSDGSIHWIEGKGRFLYDESGQAVRMLGTVVEISDRKHREEQLRLLESVVVNTNDAVLITKSEPLESSRLQIIYANAAFTRMMGYDLEEVLGLPLDLLRGSKTNPTAWERIRAAVKTGRAIRLDLISHRKDGSEIWVDLSIVPVANEQGSLTHWVAMQRDITARKQAEAELQESEQKFRQLAENIHEVFWMSNATASEILYVSPAYEQIWGRSCEDLCAAPESFFDSIHPDDRQQVSTVLETTPTQEFDHEYRVIQPNGSVRWVRDRGFPIRNESGEVYRLAGIAQDITERKQTEVMLRQINEELELRVQERTAQLKETNHRLQQELLERERVERALRKSEERWHLAIQGSNDGIWDLDIKNGFCIHSARWFQMLGYAENEILDLDQEWETRVHPDDISQVMQARQAHLQRQTPHYIAEYRLRCQDGSYKWILSRAQAVWDKAGNPVRMVGSHSDISDRKRIEEALRESKEQLQAILDNSPAVIYLLDAQNKFLLINRRYENLLSMTNEQITGKSIYEIWSPQTAAMLAEVNQKVIQDGISVKLEEVVPHDDGLHTYITIKSPLYDAQGIPYAICGISTEITERKRMEEALRESEERWQLALRGSSDGMWDWNVKTNDVFFSSRWKEIRGFAEHEIGSHLDEWLKRIHPDDFDRVMQTIEDHFSGKNSFFVAEYRVLHKNNSYMWICDRGQALWDEAGNVVRMAGSETDITARKQAEETLRQQACIFENIYDGIILTDLDGCIIDWNPRAQKMFGYTKAEALGKVPRIASLPEASAVLTRQIIEEMLKVGRWTGELYFICKEDTENLGEIGSCNRQSVCETVVVPLHSGQGQAIATIWVNRDISDRKLAEAALHRAYDELEIRVQKRTLDLAKANEELQLENAERKRIEAELKVRAQQQAAFAELGQQALAGNQLSHLMNQAVALIAQILVVEYCNVLELVPERQSLVLQAGIGWQEELVGQVAISTALDSQEGYTLLASEPVIVEDLHTEKRFRGSCLLPQQGVVSGLSVIIPGQVRPYGVLGAHTTEKRQFTKDDVYFLQATANVLATAINRKQAEAELRRARDDSEIRVQERTQDLAEANLALQQRVIERKQSEEERTKLVAILEATPDLVATASIDGRMLYLNSAARKVFGFTENENSTQLTISQAHPSWAYEIVLSEGIPAAMRDGMWVGETAFLSHDGREIPVSQLILAHKSSDGSINMLSIVARDMRYQKQVAATLVESERRWRSFLENVRLVVVGVDRDGKVDYANSYFLELVGYTIAEVVGQNWFETFLPQHLKQRVQDSFVDSLEQEFYTHNQNVILTKEGEERVVAWNNTLLKDLQGNVIGTLSIGEDITERQVIERMKDEFISVVSHELRTPLTSIHGALNLLSSGLVNTQSDKGRRVIEIAAESAERLVRLVNDILELERLESGKISLIKQTCNTADLMHQAIDMMQVMANRAGITLSISPQAIDLYADPDRIIQVLTNLLGNAIKFSPRDSTVWLAVERGRGEEKHEIPNPPIVFQVKDQGRGIPVEKIESVFERFHQVDASDSRKKGGTGLGLAICRSIVQQHGGRIWVESVLGEGSCFYFTLPMAMKDSDYDTPENSGH